MPVTYCVSHKEDVDGISSAALIKTVFDTKSTILVDYANFVPELGKLESEISASTIDRLFICDLGLSKKNEKTFLNTIKGIVSSGCEVTYIDHHDLAKDTALALKKLGVALVHTTEECTSVQIYNRFKKKIPSYAAFFAAAGALTDYMENQPIASSIVSRFDKQFLMLESSALSYMISANQNNDKFLGNIVDTLAQMKYPHEIKNGFAIAEKYAHKVSQAIKSIEGSIIKTKNLAYAPGSADSSASMVVNFVLGASERPAALVYKFKDDIDSYVVSIRGSKDCNVHLGRLVNEISSDLGGSGGGHDRACGAVVPKDRLQEFIHSLDSGIGTAR
jgi:RecJ-like exonuclease